MGNPANKIIWSTDQLEFMKANFNKLTNKALADKLGLKLTIVRMKLYELGLYKMRLEYWTMEQVAYLKANYQEKGDSEIAQIFNSKWHKDKGWTKKHIEKKRRYLKLKRSEAEKVAIHQRNVDKGDFKMCPVNAWITRGQNPEGTIVFWGKDRKIPHVKINRTYIHWSRWKWEKENGPIPKDMFVVFVGSPQIISIENLKLVSIEDHRQDVGRNSINLCDNYIAGILSHKDPELRPYIKANPELIKAKRTQLLIDRKIKTHENGKKQHL